MDIDIPYLTKPNKISPIALKKISESEYLKYKRDSEKLLEFEYYRRRLKEIELNKFVFFETKKYYTCMFADSQINQIDYDFKEEAYINLNRCFINFIISFVSFVEHCENKIVANFGNESSQFKEYKNFLNNLYDTNISYKLLYRLRNYAIHSSFPIEKVMFEKIKFDSSGVDCWFEVRVLFSRDNLLKSGTLRKKIGNELIQMDEFFDVAPFFFQVMPLIEKVLKEFIAIAKVSFLESANRIYDLMKSLNQEILGLTKMQIVNNKFVYDTKIIPVETAQYLKLLQNI